MIEINQESIGIALVYVRVCEGDVGSLDCGFVILHSIFYVPYSLYLLYSVCYILYSNINSIFYILYLYLAAIMT